MPKPTRWSYSSVSTYEACPAKWKFSYVDNIPWKPSAAMVRGTRLHSMAEEYVNGTLSRVPHEVSKIGLMLEDLKGKGAQAEAVWMLDSGWAPTLDPAAAWVKAIVDVHYLDGDTLHVKDYKSGREYPGHAGQLELYGLIGMQVYPAVRRVEVGAVYIDAGNEGAQGSLIRAMSPKLIKIWDDKARTMMADETYTPTPGGACRWCDFQKAKGGPCDY